MVGSCWIHSVFAVLSQASQYTLGLEGENINIQNIRNCVWSRWLKAEKKSLSIIPWSLPSCVPKVKMGQRPWLLNFSSRSEPYRGKCLASISFQVLWNFPPNQFIAATVPLPPVNTVQTLPTKVCLLSLLFQNLQKISCHRCHNPREEDDFLVNDKSG